MTNLFPTFHLAPRSNVINVQNQSNHIVAYDKASNKVTANYEILFIIITNYYCFNLYFDYNF